MATTQLKSVGATRINLDAGKRERAAALLNRLLAEAADLHMQCKHAHWNVAGPHFIALHKFFDELHEATGEYVDDIAERIAALGSHVHGRVQDAAEHTGLKPFPTDLKDDLGFVRALADAFGVFANSLRAAIDKVEEMEDAVTVDLLTTIDRETDKHLWFLEAHLRAPR